MARQQPQCDKSFFSPPATRRENSWEKNPFAAKLNLGDIQTLLVDMQIEIVP